MYVAATNPTTSPTTPPPSATSVVSRPNRRANSSSEIAIQVSRVLVASRMSNEQTPCEFAPARSRDFSTRGPYKPATVPSVIANTRFFGVTSHTTSPSRSRAPVSMVMG
jgi:hypothetical protein